MNWNLFLVEIVQDVIASFPQLMVVAGTVVYGMKEIRAVNKLLPNKVEGFKEEIEKRFVEHQGKLVESFDKSVEEITGNVNKAVDEISSKVNDTLTGMEQQLSSFNEQLRTTKNQVNNLVKENKVYMDIISELVSADPEMVKNGLATNIVSLLNLTKEELENYPESLIDNLPALEGVLKEVLVVGGEAALETLLKNIGYGVKDESQENQES